MTGGNDMRMRLEPSDDHLHPVEAATNFNESRYYNFYDHQARFGGWVRMGNRPNEGYAELSVCLYLPDGTVGFTFDRPRIEGHTAHDAGGLAFEVVEPFVEHHVTFDGEVLLLAEPKDLLDPRQAFADNPRVPCTIDLAVRALGRVYGGEPVDEDGNPIADRDPEQAFARGHTEQHMASSGTVTVGDQVFELRDALGIRDHSWGPRHWQAVWWYRWLTINLGPDLGLVTTVGGDEAGRVGARGFLYDRARYGDDTWVPIRAVELSTTYDDHDLHTALTAVVRTDDHAYEITGEVVTNVPLRNRRNGQLTRIAEGLTIWRCGDLVGAGMAEYLDQVVDGRPVGTVAGH